MFLCLKNKPCSSVSYVKNQKMNNMSKTQINWNKIIKIALAVLTAVAGSLGIVSCMR